MTNTKQNNQSVLSAWDLFRLKHGLHDSTKPVAYADAVAQVGKSLCCPEQIKHKIKHLEELHKALKTDRRKCKE